MKKQVKLCDGEWCEKYGRKLATRICVGCGCDLCGEDHCSAKSYFDDYLPYQLKSDFDFCSRCGAKIKLLKGEDIAAHMPFDGGYVSTHTFSGALKEYIGTLYRESNQKLSLQIQTMFRAMFLTADKRYGEEQKVERRKQEIQDEINQLRAKESELQANL